MRRIEIDEMEKILKKMPQDPEDTEEWIRSECVVRTYLIYSTEADIAVCTRCGEWTEGTGQLKGMHGQKTRCPVCRSEATALSTGMGRKGRTEWFRVLIPNRKGKTVWWMLWEYTVDFMPIGRPAVSRWLSAIYTINAKERHYYKHFPEWCWGEEHWKEYKTFRIPAPVHAVNGPMSRFDFTYLRTEGLEQIFTKSDLKYLWLDGYVQNLPPNEMIQYVRYGMMHRSVELLLKAGFTKLVWMKISQEPCRGINWQGKSLQRILGLPKRHVRKMQQINPDTNTLRIFRELTEEERDLISAELLEKLTDHCRYRSLSVIRDRVELYIPFPKWIRYMNEQSGPRIYTETWLDYIEMCRNLGAELNRKKILLPEDLRTAHDMAVACWNEKEDERKTEGIRRNARQDDFAAGGLMILPADSQKKLSLESAALNHCVKTYGDKIARGNCWIWFIRKREDPETPYYTMQTDTDGNMIQCRGDHNRDMTDEVKIFAAQFEAHLQEEIRKERATA